MPPDEAGLEKYLWARCLWRVMCAGQTCLQRQGLRRSTVSGGSHHAIRCRAGALLHVSYGLRREGFRRVKDPLNQVLHVCRAVLSMCLASGMYTVLSGCSWQSSPSSGCSYHVPVMYTVLSGCSWAGALTMCPACIQCRAAILTRAWHVCSEGLRSCTSYVVPHAENDANNPNLP